MDVVALSFLGTQIDAGKNHDRWSRWRPNIALCQQDDLIVNTPAKDQQHRTDDDQHHLQNGIIGHSGKANQQLIHCRERRFCDIFCRFNSLASSVFDTFARFTQVNLDGIVDSRCRLRILGYDQRQHTQADDQYQCPAQDFAFIVSLTIALIIQYCQKIFVV